MKFIKLTIITSIILLLIAFLVPPLYSGSLSNTMPSGDDKVSTKMKKAPPKIENHPTPVKKKKKLKVGGKSMKCKPVKFDMSSKLQDGKVNISYKKQLKAKGGKTPLSFGNASSTMPPGLNISLKGLLSGKPAKPGEYKLKLWVSDSCIPAQVVEETFKIKIYPEMKSTMAKKKGITEDADPSLKKKKAGVIVATPTLAKEKPVIESLLPVPWGALKPGGSLYIKGRNFGTKQGTIYMTGDNLPGQVKLLAIKWISDTQVRGTVDPKMENFPNQTVKIRVQTYNNKLSNTRSIGFKGSVEYTCEGHIIYGSDGSQLDCYPYICVKEAGQIRCLETCATFHQCVQPGLQCNADHRCVDEKTNEEPAPRRSFLNPS